MNKTLAKKTYWYAKVGFHAQELYDTQRHYQSQEHNLISIFVIEIEQVET